MRAKILSMHIKKAWLYYFLVSFPRLSTSLIVQLNTYIAHATRERCCFSWTIFNLVRDFLENQV